MHIQPRLAYNGKTGLKMSRFTWRQSTLRSIDFLPSITTISRCFHSNNMIAMNPSTSEVQTEREALLGRIRAWENELDQMSAENGRVVLNAQSTEDRKLVDHFENQFAIQKNRLDQMKHHVKLTGGHAGSSNELNEFGGYFDRLKEEFVAFSESLM
jgi:sulfur relay (sulfurtransferase) DsrC/TusE family protein